MAAVDQLPLDSDYIYTQYQEPEIPQIVPTVAVTGSAILTINGTVTGPNVTFSGGTSGFSYAAVGTTTLNLVSALTTKGDLYTWSSAGTRLAVGANGTVLTADSTQTTGLRWATPTTGTVTSFSASPSSIFDVATATTTPALSLDNQNANIVLAGPSSGGATTPSFRSLVNDDLPNAAWTSWTPTLTNIDVGAGSVTALYARLPNKTIIASIVFSLGAGASVTGAITFSLPVTSVSYAGTAGVMQLATAGLRDASAGDTFVGSVNWLSTTTAFFVYYQTNLITAATSATAPFTWASSDQIHAQFTYQAA